MEVRKPILRTLTEALGEGRLDAILSDLDAGRSELARRVSRSCGFTDSRGEMRLKREQARRS